jgi:hypothetical protein
MIRIWDSNVLKQRERDARDEVLAAQSDDDWEFAVLQLERGKSNLEYGFVDCPLPGCRRAKRCVGNPPVCTARCELEPGAEQDLVEEFYADIQQERRHAAAGEGRPPEVERVMHYVQEDDEEIEEIDEPPPTPRDEPGRNLEVVKEAVRKDVPPAPQQPPKLEPSPPPPPPKLEPPPPPPQPQAPLRQPEPAPAAWEPQISPETEERVNRIWAEYVANPSARFRPEPRIRSLSDDRPWSVPPWWKGER